MLKPTHLSQGPLIWRKNLHKKKFHFVNCDVSLEGWDLSQLFTYILFPFNFILDVFCSLTGILESLVGFLNRIVWVHEM